MKNKFKIGDSVHIPEVNETGIIVGVVPGGYAIQTVKYTKVYPSSDFTFEKVLDESEFEQKEKTNLNNAIVTKWSEIPGVWKKFKSPGKIDIKSLDVKDLGLSKLADIFCDTDKDMLRRSMQGVNFDNKGVCITDAHKLFFKAGKVSKKGIYPMSKFALKNYTSNIDEKYPNYQAVIPAECDYIGQFDCSKLLSYLKSAENYYNRVTKMISFCYGKDVKIGLNGEFLTDIVGSFYAMGYETLYIGLISSNRAVVVSADKKVCEKPQKSIDNQTTMFALLMPMMLIDEFLGSRDLDWNYESSVYFDFKDGEIHNGDKSVATYNPNEPEYTDVITKEQVNIVKQVTKMAGDVIPILETAQIVNGECFVKTLDGFELSMRVNGKIEDGQYIYTDGYLRKTEYNLDDYPEKNKIELKDKTIAVCDLGDFQQRLDFASNFVSDDVLRQILMSVNIKFLKDKLKISSTDAFTLFKNDFNIVSKQIDIDFNIQNSFELARVLNEISPDKKVYFNLYEGEKETFWFELDMEDIKIKIRSNNDSVYPNTDSVIPNEFEGTLEVNAEDLLKLVPKSKSKEKLEFTGKDLRTKENSVKVISSDNKPTKLYDNDSNSITIMSLHSNCKKPFSLLSNNLRCKYKKTKEGNTLLYVILKDENLPFKKKIAKKVSEKIEFAPAKKTEFAPEVKTYSEKDELKEIQKQLSFAEMMFDDETTTKKEKEQWKKRIDFLSMLLPEDKQKTEIQSKKIKTDNTDVSNDELVKAVDAIKKYNLDTTRYINKNYFVDLAEYVKNFDVSKDTLIQARYNETKQGIKSIIENIIQLDLNYNTMTDEEKNAVYRENAGLLGDLINFDVIGRAPKNLEKLKDKSQYFKGISKKIADKVIDKMSKIMPLLIKFENMKSNISIKKVLTEEEKEIEKKIKIEEKIYSQMPNVNKKVLTELIDELKISFKPLEKQIYNKETQRLNKQINEYVKNKKIAQSDTETFFNFYDRVIKTGKYFAQKEFKNTTSQGEKIYQNVYYYEVLGKQEGYAKVVDSLITNYVEKQKNNFLLSVSDYFSKMTLPIKDFKKLYLEKGPDGFEGKYLFNIKDGSKFTFKTQCVPAGGYNIQKFHYRYLSDFIDVKDAKGKKASIWDMIDKYNKANKK